MEREGILHVVTEYYYRNPGEFSIAKAGAHVLNEQQQELIDEFREDFSLEEYIVRYLQLYFHSSLEHSGEYDMKMRLLQMLYLPDSDMDIFWEYIEKNLEDYEDRFD